MERNKLIFWICLVMSTLVNIGTIVWMSVSHTFDGFTVSEIAVDMAVAELVCVMVVLKPEWSNNYTIKFVGFRPTFKPQKRQLPTDPCQHRHLGYGIVMVLMSLALFLIPFLIHHHLRIVIPAFVGPVVLAILAIIIVTEIRVRRSQ